MGWNYTREESTGFVPVPEGKHRIRIKSVEAAKSKSGNDMLAFQFNVSGCDAILYHYIVFLTDRPEITNRNLTAFFDAFKDIKEGTFKISDWVGKVGACMVSKDKNDPDKTRLAYFIPVSKQGELPAWQEPGSNGGTLDGFEEVGVSEDDLPF